MVEEYIELKDIEKDKRKEKTKKIFSKVANFGKSVGSGVVKGAGVIGSGIRTGAVAGAKKYAAYSSPEAQEKRLIAQERMLVRKKRIAKLRGNSAGMSFSNYGMNMGGNSNSSNGSSDLGISSGLSAGFGAIMGTPQSSIRTSPTRRYKTVKTTRRKLVGKGKKRKYRTYTNKKRVAVKIRRPVQKKEFNPFDMI